MKKRHFIVLMVGPDAHSQSGLIEGVLGKSLAWVPLFPGSWLLWTSSTCEKWRTRLQPILGEDVQFFLSEANPRDRAGRMPSKVWKLIRSNLSSKIEE
jgi:hypothetical protein